MGTIAQRIKATQERIVKLRDKVNELTDSLDDDNPDTSELDETQKNLDIQEKYLETLKKSERQLAVRAANHQEGDDDETDETTGTEVVVREPQRSSAASTLTVSSRRPFAVPAKKVKAVDFLFRALTVQIKHHHQKGARSMIDVLKETYGEDEGTHALMNVVCRATTAPANTSAQGWAADLVTVAIGEFFGLLIPTSIYAQLSQHGGRFTFGPNGILSMPTRVSTPTVAGAFVAQGAAIPVKQGAFAAVTMVPKKVGVISTFTREIAEHSTPSIEQLVRDAILEDTSIAIDAVLMGNAAASAIAPAGLGFGVSSQSLSGTADLAGLIGDIKIMTNALFAATNGNVRDPVWIMSPGTANNAALSTLTSTGVLPFRDEISQGRLAGYPIIKSTNTTPARTWYLMDAADFVTATGDTPRFDVTDHATLHMEDTTPTDIVGGVTAGVAATGVAKSLWQTDSLGVRMIMDMNWIMRRANMIIMQTNMLFSP